MNVSRLPTIGTPLAAAALVYAEMGWPVLPLRGKIPMTDHGLRNATPDRQTITTWWRWWPDANIGVRVPDGLLVVDLDGDPGIASWRSLGTFPATLTTRTSRGFHLWWKAPAGVELRQTAGVLPGVDSRTSKGYLVMPPSVHPMTGVVYEWARRCPPASLPDAVVGLLSPAAAHARPSAPRGGSVGTDGAGRYALAALRGEAEAVASTAEGARNDRLFRAWKRCSVDLGAVLPRAVVVNELTAAALAAGLAPREIEKVLR